MNTDEKIVGGALAIRPGKSELPIKRNLFGTAFDISATEEYFARLRDNYTDTLKEGQAQIEKYETRELAYKRQIVQLEESLHERDAIIRNFNKKKESISGAIQEAMMHGANLKKEAESKTQEQLARADERAEAIINAAEKKASDIILEGQVEKRRIENEIKKLKEDMAIIGRDETKRLADSMIGYRNANSNLIDLSNKLLAYAESYMTAAKELNVDIQSTSKKLSNKIEATMAAHTNEMIAETDYAADINKTINETEETANVNKKIINASQAVNTKNIKNGQSDEKVAQEGPSIEDSRKFAEQILAGNLLNFDDINKEIDDEIAKMQKEIEAKGNDQQSPDA